MISSKSSHYDSGSPSELEVLITRSAYNRNEARFKRARSALRRLREHRISKFNHALSRTERELGLDPSRRAGRVLVIDQTRGDSSIMYGKASGASFTQMLAAARRENVGAEIIVKLHPEVVSGRKAGHLADVDTRVLRETSIPGR